MGTFLLFCIFFSTLFFVRLSLCFSACTRWWDSSCGGVGRFWRWSPNKCRPLGCHVAPWRGRLNPSAACRCVRSHEGTSSCLHRKRFWCSPTKHACLFPWCGCMFVGRATLSKGCRLLPRRTAIGEEAMSMAVSPERASATLTLCCR